jgi:hypothetical protein
MGKLYPCLQDHQKNEKINDFDKPVSVSYCNIVIYGYLNEVRSCRGEDSQGNGQEDQKVKLHLIGLDKLVQFSQYLGVYDVTTFDIFFFQAQKFVYLDK